MTNEDWIRLRGLQSLLHDVVKQGARFVEKHHRHAAAKPFRILESINPVATPTKIARVVHDGVLSLTYGSIHAINRVTGEVDGWILDRLMPPKGDDC